MTNKEKVVNFCTKYTSSVTEDLMERDDVLLQVSKYPETELKYPAGCPQCWGLSHARKLCFYTTDTSQTENTCTQCWNEALSDK